MNRFDIDYGLALSAATLDTAEIQRLRYALYFDPIATPRIARARGLPNSAETRRKGLAARGGFV